MVSFDAVEPRLITRGWQVTFSQQTAAGCTIGEDAFEAQRTMIVTDYFTITPVPVVEQESLLEP